MEEEDDGDNDTKCEQENNDNEKKVNIAKVLTTAAENSNNKVVAELLKRGVNPDLYQNDSGETALMIAARKGNIDLVKTLLKQRLRKHDQTSIEHKIGNFHEYVFSKYFKKHIFQDKAIQKFHLREDKHGITILEGIVSLKLVKEQVLSSGNITMEEEDDGDTKCEQENNDNEKKSTLPKF